MGRGQVLPLFIAVLVLAAFGSWYYANRSNGDLIVPRGKPYPSDVVETHRVGAEPQQSGIRLILRMRTEDLPAGVTTPLSILNDHSRNVISRRTDALGLSGRIIKALGDDKILVELPRVASIQQIKELLTRQAFLEFKVPDDANPGQFRSLEPPLTGANLKPTFVTSSQGRPVVNFEFAPPDDQRWIAASRRFIGKQIQIVLDGRQISTPIIREAFGSGQGIIDGDFTAQEAADLSVVLNSGALPVRLEIIQLEVL